MLVVDIDEYLKSPQKIFQMGIYKKFMLDEQKQMEFACAVTDVGIDNIEAGAIRALSEQYRLSQKQVSSYLQKYKCMIIKDYNLASSTEIRNWMYPKMLQNSALSTIASKWKEPAVSTQEQVKKCM